MNYKYADKEHLLLKLPCKIGDTIYHAVPLCGGNVVINGFKREVTYQWQISEQEFNLHFYNDIGKEYFLTVEEAQNDVDRLNKEAKEKYHLPDQDYLVFGCCGTHILSI